MTDAAGWAVRVYVDLADAYSLPVLAEAIAAAGPQFVLTPWPSGSASDPIDSDGMYDAVWIAQVPGLSPQPDSAASLSAFFTTIHTRSQRRIRTIALTYAHPRSILSDLRRSDVAGCVERDLRLLQQLPLAVRIVASGGTFWGDHMPPLHSHDPESLLTHREHRLLAELLRHPNLNALELAVQMGVSPTTTYRRIKSICDKLGVRTPLAAVLVAQQRGLLPTL